MFIHDAVLESLTCGDTQIPASGLSSAIKKLKEKDRETGRTGFETQFHVCILNTYRILENTDIYCYEMKIEGSEKKVNPGQMT